MSRSRNIKPGFFRNDDLADCPASTRLLFIGLWCEADREGRLEYRPRRIKASIFPYDDDVNVEDGIAALAERGFLMIYEHDGEPLIQVKNWSKHQNPHHKEIASILPAPPNHKDTVCEGYIPLSNTIRKRIFERDGRICKACGAQHGLSIDHVIPVSKGGNSTDDNLQVLCLGCNVRKGNRILSTIDTRIMHDSSMVKEQSKQNASCPTDSFNLIPDSLIPDSKEEACASSSDEAPKRSAQIPYQAIADAFNANLDLLPKVREITKDRKTLIRSAWSSSKERQNVEFWKAYFEECASDPFLSGKGPYSPPHENWRPDFNHLLKTKVVTKVFEKAMDRMERGA